MTLTPLHVLQLRRELDERACDRRVDPIFITPVSSRTTGAVDSDGPNFPGGEDTFEYLRRVAGDLRRSFRGSVERLEDARREE